ncbi:MAG TPA: glycosyl hydrolase [Chloroflexota bacterium]|nr:glycosyl hydrolase [Chloroflexota bacterium]
METTNTLKDALLTSLAWRCIGPHRGGRSVAVAGDPLDPMTFYFGACAGGVWKTTDGGTYWQNISDGYFSTASIGAVAIADSDPNVLYVGTGESCIRNNVSHGDGVYRSTDGGKSWQNVGLPDSRHIGRICVHPRNPDVVYVAALGHAFGPSAERGVFRTTDGGKHWEQVLYKSDRAGAHDISMDPTNPRVLYAAIWQVQRYPHTLVNGGPDSGMWKSTDGGDTWIDITRRPGLPKGVLGKLGVAVSPARSGRVWALVEADDGALFRSDDDGETWDRVCAQSSLRTRPWYYMHVFADPQDPETCWVLNYRNWKSTDGGVTFSEVPIPHGDNHDLWIDPRNTQRMIHGNDGGACVSFDGGVSWSTIYNQPTAQLYHVITDDQVPYRVYGSQQDNTAISLASRSANGPITQQDWFAPGGGESGYVAVKHDDPNVVVGSGPQSRRVFNHYMTAYDRRTGAKRDITVWPELYGWGEGAESLKYRFQWTFPIVFSRHQPDVLYACSNHVHRSTDIGASWEVISADLTRNDPSKLGPSGGPVTRDNTGAEVYCVIYCLAESPHQAGVLWAGTDDGLIHISEDAGKNWRDATPGPDVLPEWALISIIEPSPHDPAAAYVAATRYKLDDTAPYLLKTNDFGQSWTKITDGIPSHEFTRVIREDPGRRGLLYAGTETGLYVSFDDGRHWEPLKGNFPVVPVYDLVIKDVEMVVASHGRSFWILDDLTPLHQLSGEIVGQAEHLFQPRPSVRLHTPGRRFADNPRPAMVNYDRVDTSVVAYVPIKGERHYLDAGSSPAPGVHFNYFLRDAPDGPLTLDILSVDGHTILRSFSSNAAPGQPRLPAAAGMNRFVWNMRLPGAPRLDDDSLDPWQRDDGPIVLSGTYQARLTVSGHTRVQPFSIVPDPRVSSSSDDRRVQFEVLQTILEKIATTNRLINRIGRLQAQVAAWESRTADRAAGEVVRAAAGPLAAELESLKERLIDVHYPEAQLYGIGLQEKLNALFEFVDSADYAPPRQGREVLDDLSARLDAVAGDFERSALPKLHALNEAMRRADLAFVVDQM